MNVILLLESVYTDETEALDLKIFLDAYLPHWAGVFCIRESICVKLKGKRGSCKLVEQSEY